MTKTAKETLHRDAWLKKALDVLFSHGINDVKVEILARELDVTKGSFYWHFKNREALLNEMVDWWRNNQIEFIDTLDVSHIRDAPNLIRSVIDFTDHTDDSHHDVAMREFARSNDHAPCAVAEIDQRRIDHLKLLFAAAGFDHAQSLVRAKKRYFSQVGQNTPSLTTCLTNSPSGDSTCCCQLYRTVAYGAAEEVYLCSGHGATTTLPWHGNICADAGEHQRNPGRYTGRVSGNSTGGDGAPQGF
ncbi:MAG: TetR/AcrR family transcriptional regulator [Gammaproteobacteria bacterium]